MNITELANKVLAEIDTALALAEKATPGPWCKDWGRIRDDGCNTLCIVAQSNAYDSEPWVSNAIFIAISRTLLPASLRCLKTAIEGLLRINNDPDEQGFASAYGTPTSTLVLTTLCDQWEASR